MNPIMRIIQQSRISRMELARRTQIPYVTLTSIAGGLTAKLQKRTLSKLAEFSGIPEAELAETYRQWRDRQAQERPV